MTQTQLVKGLSWEALPEVRLIMAVRQDAAIEGMRKIADDWTADGEDVAQVQVSLPLILVDFCRLVLSLDAEQTARALGPEMYEAALSLEDVEADR